jgi:hypothetical protein
MDMSGKIEHPKIRDILDFQGCGADSVSVPEVGEHIATCERCYAIFRGVVSLERRIAEAFPEDEPTASCPEDWEIAALVAKETGSDAALRVSAHLEGCSHCVDRAAQYHKALTATPSVLKAPDLWKKAAIRVMKADPEKAVEPETTLLSRIRYFLREIVAPLPPLPGYVTATVAIALLVWFSMAEREKMLIIPSTEKIAIREAEPTGTMGFMGQWEDRTVSRMKLRIIRDTVLFRWDPGENESESTFSLVLKASRAVVFTRKDVKEAAVSVPKRLIEAGKVYTWFIVGQTKDGRVYEYTGEILPTK